MALLPQAIRAVASSLAKRSGTVIPIMYTAYIYLSCKGGEMPFVWDEQDGSISDNGIRYVLIRPDVLMGIAHELPSPDAARSLTALQASAFRRSRASFEQYRKEGRFNDSDLLAASLPMATYLGWGVWTFARTDSQSRVIEVRNSPFAAGYGASKTPVCAPIAGVLGAMALVASGTTVHVEELECSAQGFEVCRFRVTGSGK